MKKSKRGLWILGFLCVMVSGIVLSNSKSRAKTVIYPTVASGEQVKESNRQTTPVSCLRFDNCLYYIRFFLFLQSPYMIF